MKTACTIFLELLTCGVLFAGQGTVEHSPMLRTSSPELDEVEATSAPYVIFSNLGPAKGNRFISNPFLAFPIAGKSAGGGATESWFAVRFSPNVDVQATILMAAVGYTSGTKLVTLGIYSNNDATGSVG